MERYQWFITLKSNSLPGIVEQWTQKLYGVDMSSIKAQRKMCGKVKFVLNGTQHDMSGALRYIIHKSDCSILKIKRGYKI